MVAGQEEDMTGWLLVTVVRDGGQEHQHFTTEDHFDSEISEKFGPNDIVSSNPLVTRTAFSDRFRSNFLCYKRQVTNK